MIEFTYTIIDDDGFCYTEIDCEIKATIGEVPKGNGPLTCIGVSDWQVTEVVQIRMYAGDSCTTFYPGIGRDDDSVLCNQQWRDRACEYINRWWSDDIQEQATKHHQQSLCEA
jgi:hypothetical protein